MGKKIFFDIINLQNLNKQYHLSISKKVSEILLKSVYSYYKKLLEKEGLIKKVQDATVFNAVPSKFINLYNAIHSNLVIYKNGIFTGSFNSKVKEELLSLKAIYRAGYNGYYIALLPKEIDILVKEKQKARENFALMAMLSFPIIKSFVNDKISKINIQKQYKEIHNELFEKLAKTVDSTAIANDELFIEKYTASTKFNIKGFVAQDIEKLRNKIINLVKQGGRPEDIKGLLNENFNLNKKRIARIAKQEFNLATKIYQYEFLQSSGNDLFYWIHTHRRDPNARAEHINFAEASDNGKIYKYSELPINPKTNKPDAPGILPNCHCLARFIVATK